MKKQKTQILRSDTREGLDRQIEGLKELGFRIIEAQYEGTKQLSLGVVS